MVAIYNGLVNKQQAMDTPVGIGMKRLPAPSWSYSEPPV